MQISFDLPHVFDSRGSSPVENSDTLQALLECLIRIDQVYLREHPRTPSLYRSGVVYGRTTIWDSIPALYARRYGDCKSLTAALCAEYRQQGKPAKPVFRFAYGKDGSTLYHILVQVGITAEGLPVYEDPSKVLGMNLDENQYFENFGFENF